MSNGSGRQRAGETGFDPAVDWTPDVQNAVIESIFAVGDISRADTEAQARHYDQTCRSMGLNPATMPLMPIRLNGKLVLYPTRGATDQLAAIHRINREIIEGPDVREILGAKIGYAKCRATHPNGRTETAIATVPATDPAMLYMKLETKAKRRATLSILGLGMLDESEVSDIPARDKAPASYGPVRTNAEAPASPPETASLARLRDDLASYGPDITADQAAQCFLDMRDEGADPSDLGDGFELAKRAARLSAAALKRAIDRASTPRPVSAAEAAAMDPTLAEGEPPAPAHPTRPAVPVEARDWNAAATDDARPPVVDPPAPAASAPRPAVLDESVIAEHEGYYAHARSLAEVTDIDAEVKKLALAPRSAVYRRLVAARKAALARLQPPTPPTGTDAPTAANDAPRATGDAREAAPASGAQASAAWRAHLADMRSAEHVRRSFAKHHGEHRAAGIEDETRRAAAERICALWATDDLMGALAYLRGNGSRRAA